MNMDKYHGSQGGQVGYMLNFHSGILGLTPVQAKIKKKTRVPFMTTGCKAFSNNV